MHEIAQNCVCIAQKTLAVGASPQIPMGSLQRSTNAPSRLGRVKLPVRTSPPQRFRRLALSSSASAMCHNVPLPKQFSGSAPGLAVAVEAECECAYAYSPWITFQRIYHVSMYIDKIMLPGKKSSNFYVNKNDWQQAIADEIRHYIMKSTSVEQVTKSFQID